MDESGVAERKDRRGELVDERLDAVDEAVLDVRDPAEAVEGPHERQHRSDASGLEQLRRIERHQAGGRRGRVQDAQAAGELAHGTAARLGRHRRPAARQHVARQAPHDQPVRSRPAAVRDDRWVAELGGQESGEGGFAAQAAVHLPVDAHDQVIGEPDLVGHAAGGDERGRAGQPGFVQSLQCAQLGPAASPSPHRKGGKGSERT